MNLYGKRLQFHVVIHNRIVYPVKEIINLLPREKKCCSQNLFSISYSNPLYYNYFIRPQVKLVFEISPSASKWCSVIDLEAIHGLVSQC